MASKKSPLRAAFEAIAHDCELMRRGRESVYGQVFPELRPRLVTEDETTRKKALREGDRLWERLTGLPALVNVAAWGTLARRLGVQGPLDVTAITEEAVWWAKGLQTDQANAPANYLGDGKVQIGVECYRLEGQAEIVLEALVELRAATKDELAEKSGVDDAHKVLATIRKNLPALASHITFPGGKGKGGYRTTILRGES